MKKQDKKLAIEYNSHLIFFYVKNLGSISDAYDEILEYLGDRAEEKEDCIMIPNKFNTLPKTEDYMYFLHSLFKKYIKDKKIWDEGTQLIKNCSIEIMNKKNGLSL